MTLSRRLARPMLASIFVVGGMDALRNPGSKVKVADDVAPKIAARLGLPQDTELLIKINGGAQVGAGMLLAVGKFRRTAALVLIGSLLPTTYAGHRFWEVSDPEERARQQIHFFKNLGLLGGLILALVDTEGAPSLTWRSRRAARQAAHSVAAGAASITPDFGGGSSLADQAKRPAAAVVAAAPEVRARTRRAAKAAARQAAAHQPDLAKAGRAAADRGSDVLERVTTTAGEVAARRGEVLDRAGVAAQRAARSAGHYGGIAADRAGHFGGIAADRAGQLGSVAADRAGDLWSSGSSTAGDLFDAARDHLPVA